jgi:hypothetical protein
MPTSRPIAPARSGREQTPPPGDPALMRQLAALGSNLNQIARAVNECRLVGAPVHLVELLALLRSIEEEAGPCCRSFRRRRTGRVTSND